MAEEQQQELKEYVITKIGEDGRKVQDKSSEDYTGKALNIQMVMYMKEHF